MATSPFGTYHSSLSDLRQRVSSSGTLAWYHAPKLPKNLQCQTLTNILNVSYLMCKCNCVFKRLCT